MSSFIWPLPPPPTHRCILLPLLGVKPPQQSLFLLVDSIDEGCQLGEGEQRSSPGSPRTIAELLASHHEFLPPWLLLVCSARRQNKAITKLFTGKQPSPSHPSQPPTPSTSCAAPPATVVFQPVWRLALQR